MKKYVILLSIGLILILVYLFIRPMPTVDDLKKQINESISVLIGIGPYDSEVVKSGCGNHKYFGFEYGCEYYVVFQLDLSKQELVSRLIRNGWIEKPYTSSDKTYYAKPGKQCQVDVGVDKGYYTENTSYKKYTGYYFACSTSIEK